MTQKDEDPLARIAAALERIANGIESIIAGDDSITITCHSITDIADYIDEAAKEYFRRDAP